MIFINPLNGKVEGEDTLDGIKASDCNFIMVADQNEGSHDHLILALPNEKSSSKQISVFPKGKKLIFDLESQHPYYYTQINKETGKMSGYRILN